MKEISKQEKKAIYRKVLDYTYHRVDNRLPIGQLAKLLVENIPEYFNLIFDIAFYKKYDYIWTSKCNKLFSYMNNGIILTPNERDEFLRWCWKYYGKESLKSELYIAFDKSVTQYIERGVHWYPMCTSVLKYTLMHYQAFLRSAYSLYMRLMQVDELKDEMATSYIGEGYIPSYLDFDINDNKQKRLKIYFQYLNKKYNLSYIEFCKILSINSIRTMDYWVNVDFKKLDLYNKYFGNYY